MPALLALLPLTVATAMQGPLDTDLQSGRACSQNSLIVCVQNIGGAGGSGGNGTQPILCYGCTIQGATGGAGGPGGNVNSKKDPITPAAATMPPATTTAVNQPPISLIARCQLNISGETVVDSRRCNYDKVGKRFTLSAQSANKKYVYTIALVLNDNKTGSGSLSGGNSAKTRDLGVLNRAGACWVNDTVKICAWQ